MSQPLTPLLRSCISSARHSGTSSPLSRLSRFSNRSSQLQTSLTCVSCRARTASLLLLPLTRVIRVFHFSARLTSPVQSSGLGPFPFEVLRDSSPFLLDFDVFLIAPLRLSPPYLCSCGFAFRFCLSCASFVAITWISFSEIRCCRRLLHETSEALLIERHVRIWFPPCV